MKNIDVSKIQPVLPALLYLQRFWHYDGSVKVGIRRNESDKMKQSAKFAQASLLLSRSMKVKQTYKRAQQLHQFKICVRLCHFKRFIAENALSSIKA